jgi:hypothetical protein
MLGSLNVIDKTHRQVLEDRAKWVGPSACDGMMSLRYRDDAVEVRRFMQCGAVVVRDADGIAVCVETPGP